MYFDFHVHAFNDKIAQRAISSLEKTAGYTAYTDGTLEDTRKKLIQNNISRAVLLPVATKPSQQKIINDWAKASEDDFFVSFGSVHPDADDVIEELTRIKKIGLHGVKMHPDYICTFADDPKMLRVYRKCAELDLPVIIHGGYDPLSPEVIHALPEASARAFDAVPEMTFIIAHLGGMYHWDEVEKYLVGKKGNLYFDIAVINRAIDDNNLQYSQIERIVKNHGVERILFASDCPWDCPANEIDIVNNHLNLTDEEKELIFHKNAEKLLKLN